MMSVYDLYRYYLGLLKNPKQDSQINIGTPGRGVRGEEDYNPLLYLQQQQGDGGNFQLPKNAKNAGIYSISDAVDFLKKFPTPLNIARGIGEGIGNTFSNITNPYTDIFGNLKPDVQEAIDKNIKEDTQGDINIIDFPAEYAANLREQYGADGQYNQDPAIDPGSITADTFDFDNMSSTGGNIVDEVALTGGTTTPDPGSITADGFGFDNMSTGPSSSELMNQIEDYYDNVVEPAGGIGYLSDDQYQTYNNLMEQHGDALLNEQLTQTGAFAPDADVNIVDEVALTGGDKTTPSTPTGITGIMGPPSVISAPVVTTPSPGSSNPINTGSAKVTAPVTNQQGLTTAQKQAISGGGGGGTSSSTSNKSGRSDSGFNTGGNYGPHGGSSGGGGGGGGCFLKGTLVTMADGSTKEIEKVDLGDVVAAGGKVFATGKFLVNNLHDYKGVKVSGSHMVNEEGNWVRVEDSKHGKLLGDEEHTVYVFGCERRRILIENILFTDYFEVNEQDKLSNNSKDFFENWKKYANQDSAGNVELINAS